MGDPNDLNNNISIHSQSDDSEFIDLILDGAIFRVPVDSKTTIVDNEALTKYKLKSDFDAAGVALNTSTDVSLFSFTGNGAIDFIAVTGSNAFYEIAIKVDGTERIRITMAELASVGLSNAVNLEMWVETANKNFRYHPQNDIGFATTFEILAKATQAPLATVEHLVLFRERT